MPRIPAPEIVGNISRFLRETGYTEAQLKQLGLTKVPWRKSVARSLLPYKIPDNAPLNLLVGLFWFGETARCEKVSSAFPPQIVKDLLYCELLEREADVFVPQCMLVHFGELLLACDSVRRAQATATSDLVLGTNTPTKILANSLIKRSCGEVLDLGTGCGTLALVAGRFARAVTATDINPRALEFTEFNAALNGITNVQPGAGDRFVPVEGHKFDLVACNPPFFLNTASRLLFTDNSAELDSFVKGLTQSAPQFLKEGGFFQMLCEWVAIPGESWPHRLKHWFDHSGCDVLILKAYEMNPADYVLTRAAESASLHGEPREEQVLEHINYFRRWRVERIYGGLVTMRRRAAENWYVCDEMEEAPDETLGEFLFERFAMQDILASCEGTELLALKPRLSKGAQLVEESVQQSQSWKPRRIYLERRAGIPKRLAFDKAVADFVARFDGKRPLSVLVKELANENKVPRQQAEENGLKLIRKLSSLGLIVFDR